MHGVTTFAPIYRLVVYAPRSSDPSEAIALQPVAGAPHTDYLKVTSGPAAAGPARITAAVLSHAGMTVFTAANCVDQNLANTGWGTDAAVAGATLQADLGAGVARAFTTCRIYVLTGTYAGIYDVEYSDNGAAWSKAVVGFKPTIGDSWHSIAWQDVGAHRYWRLLLTNTPGAGPELAELELWEADGPGDWKPYLAEAPPGRSGKIDRLNKKTDIGVRSFRVIDTALTPGQNATRWLTAAFGDLKGKLRVGNLRAAAWESTDGGLAFVPFWSGRVRQAQLIKPNLFDLRVREVADDMEALMGVGRPHLSVTQAGFQTLLPIGSSIAYGTGPAAIPAVKPMTGTMFGVLATVHGVVVLDVASVGRDDNLVTANLLEAVAQPSMPESDAGIQIPWPTFTGTGRVRLKRLDTNATGIFKVGSVGQSWNGNRTHNRCVSLWMAELPVGSVGYLPLPPNGTAVEVTVEAEHLATKETPILVDGLRWPQLWRLLLEGKFGYLWTPPETLPPGRVYGDARVPIRYNAAKFATLEADERFPVERWIIRKREPRGKFIERENMIHNLAYYRDASGVIQPVDCRLPSDVSSAPTITDADIVIPEDGSWPTWGYDRSKAVTRVDGAFYTDLQQTVADLNASSELYPRITGGGLQELRHPVMILDVGNSDIGDEPYALDATGFRSMPGEMFAEQIRVDYLALRLMDMAIDIARPNAAGEVTSVLPCRRGGTGDAQAGELRKVTVSTLVDPGTNKRGGTRLVQVLERTPRGAYIELTVVDLGLSTAGAGPTLGVPAQEAGNTTAGITVQVTLNGDAHPVEVHYAATLTSQGTAPLDGDKAWTSYSGGLVRANSTIAIRQLPAGKRIWVRGRAFPDARVDYKLPSAWVPANAPGRVDTAALAAPSAPTASLQTARSFRVSITPGAPDLPTEWLMATPTSDPRIVVARLVPGSTLYDFPGDTGLLLLPSTTYRVGVRHYGPYGAVSAEVTVDVSTTTVEPTFPPISIQPRIFFGKTSF